MDSGGSLAKMDPREVEAEALSFRDRIFLWRGGGEG